MEPPPLSSLFIVAVLNVCSIVTMVYLPSIQRFHRAKFRDQLDGNNPFDSYYTSIHTYVILYVVLSFFFILTLVAAVSFSIQILNSKV